MHKLDIDILNIMANFQLAADLLTAIFNGITDKIRDKYYPIGTIYMSLTNKNPSEFIGGTWVEIQGVYLIGQDSNTSIAHKTLGATIGDWSTNNTTLTIDQIPSHTHWQRSRGSNGNIAQSGNGIGAEFLGTSGDHIRRNFCYWWQ